MNNPNQKTGTLDYSLDFPWVRFLIRSLFWSFIALLILAFLRSLFSPMLEMQGEYFLSWKDIFSPRLWVEAFLNALFSLLRASIVMIPSFYAGMTACLYLENKGATHEKQYETAFRVSSILAFFLFVVLLSFVAYKFGRPVEDLAIDLIELLIIFYIFDSNVAETVWEDVFSHRLDRRN